MSETTTTYKFEELIEPAKAKVREWYAQNTDNYWAECAIGNATVEGRQRGFDIDDVQWSGFHSQGDGASWQGRLRIRSFLDFHLKGDNPDFARYTVLAELIDNEFVDDSFPIYMRSFMYNHSRTMQTEGPTAYRTSNKTLQKGILAGADGAELYESIDIDDLIDRLTEWALDEARSYADDIYKQLEKEYEYEMSDEHIQKTAEINEWRFDEDGYLA